MRKPNMAREATQMHPTGPDPNAPIAQGAQPDQPAVKQKRKRSASPPRPAFFIIQVLGDDGQPIPFDKKRIKILSVERSAEKVFEMIDGGQHDNALYLRGIVPAGRGGPPTAA